MTFSVVSFKNMPEHTGLCFQRPFLWHEVQDFHREAVLVCNTATGSEEQGTV